MSRVRSTRIVLAALAVVVGAAALGRQVWYEPRRVPAGQPELVRIDGVSLAMLRDRFNAAVGETRLLALLSPT